MSLNVPLSEGESFYIGSSFIKFARTYGDGRIRLEVDAPPEEKFKREDVSDKFSPATNSKKGARPK